MVAMLRNRGSDELILARVGSLKIVLYRLKYVKLFFLFFWFCLYVGFRFVFFLNSVDRKENVYNNVNRRE